MQSLIKTVVASATFAAVFAGAVIFYVNYQIDQVTRAVVAPITQTGERVGGAVKDVERSVSSIIDSGEKVVEDVADKVDALPDAVKSTTTDLAEDIEETGETVFTVVETSTERVQRAVEDTGDKVMSLWNVTRSELVQG